MDNIRSRISQKSPPGWGLEGGWLRFLLPGTCFCAGTLDSRQCSNPNKAPHRGRQLLTGCLHSKSYLPPDHMPWHELGFPSLRTGSLWLWQTHTLQHSNQAPEKTSGRLQWDHYRDKTDPERYAASPQLSTQHLLYPTC